MQRPCLLAFAAVLSFAALGRAAPATGFWAVYSNTSGRADRFSVLVGNPDQTRTATVAVETEEGAIASASVPPGSTHEFDLGFNRKAAETVHARLAYRVRSDIPVHAFAFLGFSSGGGNSSGALLLDASVLGNDYLVMASRGEPAPSIRRSLVTVVAPGPVCVTVVPSAATLAGPGVPALAAGENFTADLEAFDVLQLAGESAADLTGTTVTASEQVEVLAGCDVCHIDGSSADHVQEVMMPLSWWGTTAIGAASNPYTDDVNVWRILAAEDGTEVTTDPPMPGTPTILDRGRFVEFQSTSSFAVSASKPVLVARYNTLGVPGDPVDADPAMCLMLPPERFVTSAVFRLPLRDALLWVDLVARPGTSVSVDGTPVPQADFTAIGASGFAQARVPLSGALATHSVAADEPIAAYAGYAESATAATFPVDIDAPPDLAPVCDAGGPYSAPCAGPLTGLGLDSSASTDPEGAPLVFLWTAVAPEVTFDQPTSPSARATVTGLGTFDVSLEVSDGRNRATCATTVTVTGEPAAPPEVGRTSGPLWLAKRGGGLFFTWEDVGGTPVSYNVYEGWLRSFESHLPLACNLAPAIGLPGRREAVLTPGPDSRYYLVTAAGCAAEGPSGMDPGGSTCPP